MLTWVCVELVQDSRFSHSSAQHSSRGPSSPQSECESECPAVPAAERAPRRARPTPPASQRGRRGAQDRGLRESPGAGIFAPCLALRCLAGAKSRTPRCSRAAQPLTGGRRASVGVPNRCRRPARGVAVVRGTEACARARAPAFSRPVWRFAVWRAQKAGRLGALALRNREVGRAVVLR